MSVRSELRRQSVALRLNDLVANGVADEIAERTEAQFAHQARAMRFDRLDADAKCRCRFLVAFAFGLQEIPTSTCFRAEVISFKPLWLADLVAIIERLLGTIR